MPRGSLLLAAAFAALLIGCGHAPGYPPDPILRPDAVSDFATLYNQNCSACHGATGQSGPAIDLANPEYQALVDDATLRKWISGGMPGTEMPAFVQSQGGMLTDAQVNALVAGMRQEWSRPNAFAGAKPPPYAETQIGDPHHGELAYQAHCASCHEPSRQQISSSVYLSLIGDQALRDIIVAGRPDIGQPDWRNDGRAGKSAVPLSEQDVDDIVSYLASLRNALPQSSANTAPSQSPADGRQTK
ncbi:MAG: c-type cytochrome [Terracidiphilus sp.]|jgi:mono/diheme cytochrome c family protein